MHQKSFRFWPKELPHELTYPQTSFDKNLFVSALRYPDRCFIDFYGRALSYAEGERIVTRLAACLQAEGLEPGDRVVLYMQNCPQFILAFQAILRAGGVVVPVNPMNMAPELAYIIENSGAKIAFVGEELLERAAEPLAGLRRVVSIRYGDSAPAEADFALPELLRTPPRKDLPANAMRWAQAVSAAGEFDAPDIGPQDMAALVYSSGTTGAPKGCVHTHASMTATAIAGALWQRVSAEAVHLTVAPLFHVTGVQLGMNRCIWAGATIVLMQRWDVRLAALLAERRRVTHWSGVPLLIAELLADPEASRRDLSSIRMFSGGGAAMPAAVAAQVKERFGVDFVEGYGLTETMAQTHENPPERAKRQCLGIPTFGVDAIIVDPTSLAILPPGETGEILVRGPGLFKGYWKNEEATHEAFVEVDGRKWFRTGDLGRTDEDGYFFFADRLKRMINAGGYKIWPAEVENMMFAHPAIQECCIVAAPDDRRGEVVKAIVAPRAGVAPSDELAHEIIEWCRDKMSAYKVPRRVAFVEALPRGGTGKVDWRRLQEKEFAD